VVSAIFLVCVKTVPKVGLDVPPAVSLNITMFWGDGSHLVDKCHCSSKHSHLPTKLYGFTFKKTIIFIVVKF
jgi:hypothetical protein